MKKFEAPEMTVVEFEAKDVIVTSEVDDGFGWG